MQAIFHLFIFAPLRRLEEMYSENLSYTYIRLHKQILGQDLFDLLE